jgi:O-succinylbenzoic acid--CoA ligase
LNRLVALDLPGGPGFVDELRRAWDDGDAVLPVDGRLPAPAREAVLDALAPGVVVDPSGRHDRPGGRPVDDGDAVVTATSGTTGVPKGVVHTHAALAAKARAVSAALAVDPATDRWLCCLPLAHVGGLDVVTRALLTGTPVEVHPGFDVDAVLDAARRGATLTSLVPTALARLPTNPFRVVLVGGSAPPPDRPASVVATYGLTESFGGVVFEGWPLDGIEVRVADGGEIHLRGPALLRCYRDGRDPKDADGWFATGDLGAVGSDGRLTVEGRRDELIVSGGENVWPEPVERILSEHPDVAEVAVVGRPHAEWGQQVTAVVVPSDRGTPDLAELRAMVRDRLGAFAAPGALELVDSLPKTALGKVRRHLV